MIFYYNTNGELISCIPDRVYQGSNQVNTIYFICPVASGNKVGVSFTLPNGTSTTRQQMYLTSQLDSSITDEYGNNFSAYQYKIPFSITKDYGTLICQFCIYSDNNEEVLTTESVNIIIERGVYISTPDIADPLNLAIDYDTDEKNSGAKWITNDDIYKRTISITLITTAGVEGSYTINNALKPDYQNILKYEGYCELIIDDESYYIPLNCYYPQNIIQNNFCETYVNLYNDDDYIYIKYKIPASRGTCKITLYYTKN